jgi:hypothetical protein
MKIRKLFTKIKKKYFLFFFILVAGFVGVSILYHNDAFYLKFQEKMNPRVKSLVNIDLIQNSNKFAHFFDIKGQIKQIQNPLVPEDFIDIKIATEQEQKLIEFLQKTPVKKKWVAIEVVVDGELLPAKLKFHGTDLKHYNGKNSYTIKLDKEGSYIDNFRRFKLIKGEEFDPTIIAVNKAANSLGLISSFGEMKILRINNKEKGHYYFVEDIKKEFLEREYGITNYSILTNASDTYTRKEGKISSHISDNDLHFTHIKKGKGPLFQKALAKYKDFTGDINAKNMDEVKSSLDLDYMAKYLALAAIFNDVHFMLGDNLKLIYDFNRGKFYPIFRIESGGVPIYKDYIDKFPLFNEILFESYHGYSDSETLKLFKFLLTDNEFRNKRDYHFNLYYSKKESLLKNVRATHYDNEKIMVHSVNSRRVYDLKKKHQLRIMQATLDIGKEYIDYGHVYMSYDSISEELSLLIDAYSPINVIDKNGKVILNKINGIEFDSSFKPIYNYQTIKINDNAFLPQQLVFVNATTKDTLSKKFIYINYIDKKSTSTYSKSTIKMLEENKINYKLIKDSLFISEGSYNILSDVLIDSKYLTFIPQDTRFKLDENINMCMAGSVNISGAKNHEVAFERLNKNKNFGTIAFIGGDPSTKVNINHLNISGGSSSYFMDRLFTSQMTIINSNVNIKNSTFTESLGDDGLNIKYSKVEIDSCNFFNNYADQVDLDFCMSKVTNSNFSPSSVEENGDGLDLSGSFTLVENCIFTNFLDKGLSIGERSKVLLKSNNFEKNKTAVAVKDQSKLFSWENSFIENELDFVSYIKKAIFNDPTLYLEEDIKSIKLDIQTGKKFHLTKKIKIEKIKFFNTSYKLFRANSNLSNKLYLKEYIE